MLPRDRCTHGAQVSPGLFRSSSRDGNTRPLLRPFSGYYALPFQLDQIGQLAVPLLPFPLPHSFIQGFFLST